MNELDRTHKQLDLCISSQSALLHKLQRVERVSASRMRRLKKAKARISELESLLNDLATAANHVVNPSA